MIHPLEFPEQSDTALLPPHNLDAERAMLGSVLLDREVIGRVAAIVQQRDFYRERHGVIYAAMLALFERSEPVDYVTLTAELGNDALTTDLVDLLGAVPSPIHAEHYANLVAECAVKRRLISAGGKIARLGFQKEHDAATVLEKSEQILLDVSSQRKATDSRSFGAYLSDYMDELLKIHEGQAVEAALPTGYADLDRILSGGMRRSELTVLAARPAMGKSSLSTNIAVTAAMRFGASVAIFSLEMTGQQLVRRALSAEARIEAARLLAPMTPAEESRLGPAVVRLAEMRIEVAEPLSLTPSDLRARVRRMSAREPLDLVIVDHIGLMSTGRRGGNRVEEVTEITRQLKALAMNEGVAVLALSQLSRAVEQRSPKIPMLSDLRESGSIEQDADVVIFIYRDDYYDRESAKRGIADLIVAKNRNGPTGQVSVLWDQQHTRFVDTDVSGQEEQAKWWQ